MSLLLRRWLHRMLGGCAALGLLLGLALHQDGWVRWSVLLAFAAAGMGIASLLAVRGPRVLWLLGHLTLIVLGTMMALAVPSLIQIGGPDLRAGALMLITLAIACGAGVAHGHHFRRRRETSRD